MRIIYSALLICLVFSVSSYGQDEGSITRKERIGRSNNIFIAAGPAFNFGKNIGDYGTGLNIEVGYSKRLNRLLSIGPSISYQRFKYDPEKTSAEKGAFYGHGDVNTSWYGSDYASLYEKYPGLENAQNFDYNYGFDYAYVLSLQGGDVSMISLSCNIKINIVPVKDKSIFSAYIFAKPFVTSASRKAVSGTGVRYIYEAYEDFNGNVPGAPGPDDFENDDILRYNTGDDLWYPDGYTETWDGTDYDALKKKNAITGGVFVGFGVELFPAKRLSFFLQPGIGYTFPVSFVSTKAYDNTIASYVKDEFPMVKKGFTSLNIQVGVSYNF